MPFSPTTWGARLIGLWAFLSGFFILITRPTDALVLILAILQILAGLFLMLGK